MPPSAPTPGAGDRAEQNRSAKQVATITIRDESRVIAIHLIPPMEKLLVRKATGLPFEAFWGDEDRIGEDSLIVMWWLAGRVKNPFLTYNQAVADWPTDLEEDDIKFEVNDPDLEADDPEA